MTLKSRKKRKSTDRGDFGFAMARNAAFLAVLSLWDKRRKAGLKQTELAKIIDRDPSWVNTQLKGPGNWTMRTFGELVEALNGEVEIQVVDRDAAISSRSNYDAYAVHDENSMTSTSNLIRIDSSQKPAVRSDFGGSAKSIDLKPGVVRVAMVSQ